MTSLEDALLWYVVAGLVWAPQCYAGCLARAQRGNPLSARRNFRTDLTCSLIVAGAVLLLPPLGFVVYWLTGGFSRGMQWWR